METGERIGPLLARLRLGRGLSQVELAGGLCDAAATPTLTRHEVSRWEREQRVPGRFWREWLAVVLEAPLEQLEAAIAVSRPQRWWAELAEQSPQLLQPPVAVQLLAQLDHARVGGLAGLAHVWLAGPSDAEASRGGQWNSREVPAPGHGTGHDVLRSLEARLRVLRRTDDVVGGLDLAVLVDRELRAAIETLRTIGTGGLRNRALRVVAEYAQLVGWVQADAGQTVRSRRAYRVALHAAAGAGDHELGAYVLGSLAHHRPATGDPAEALALAKAGLAAVQHQRSSLLRALLLHRVAEAAALAGKHREAETALATAGRAIDQIGPGQDPAWLYWLDEAELTAMTGRCLAALGRPVRAVRLLAHRARAAAGARTAALDGVTLARCYVELREAEEACRVASQVLTDVTAIGSARVTARMRLLRAVLLRYRDVAAVRRYQQRAAMVLDRRPPKAKSG